MTSFVGESTVHCTDTDSKRFEILMYLIS